MRTRRQFLRVGSLLIPAAFAFPFILRGQGRVNRAFASRMIVGGGTTAPVDPPFTGTTLYVNTASTSGGDGTTNGTAGATRAFASLREAIVSFGDSVLSSPTRILCEGTAADTLGVTQTHWNNVETTAANYLLITTTLSNRHDGKWNTSKYRLEITNDRAIYNNRPGHVRLVGLQAKVTGADNNCYRLSTANVGSGYTDCDCRVINCIARGDNSSGQTGHIHSEFAGTGTMRVANCISYGLYCGFNSAWSGVTYYNCTGYGNQFNFMDPQVTINCLSAGATVGNGFESVGTGGGLSDYNASDDATAVGTHKRINQTFSFVNAGTGDLHLASNDAGARGYGVSNPASGLFSDDIDGQTRSGAWDIGADQYV